MKKDDIDSMLERVDPPKPERIAHQEELKLSLLRYRRSSKVGLWLLVLPVIVGITHVLKQELALSSGFLDGIRGVLAAIDSHPVFTVLIPIIFFGLPCAAMILNFLAVSHFALEKERKELLVTIRYRFVNIAVFLISFAVLVFFLLPDMMSF